MQRITPMLWFDHQAEEAAKFYTSIFKKKSKITDVTRYDDASSKAAGRPKGSVMMVAFELQGQKFLALNGGPQFPFTEAVSLVVKCKNQGEIDKYWRKLTAGGGREVQCGWLKDKFGLSWQVVPRELDELLTGDDPARTARVMAAVLSMVKLDVKAMKAAAKKPKRGKNGKKAKSAAPASDAQLSRRARSKLAAGTTTERGPRSARRPATRK